MRKRFMKGTALVLTSAMVLQSADWSGLRALADNSDSDIDSQLAYFVDCGDYNVNTLSEGDKFGNYNSVTDQVYGTDAKTGKKWGIVDNTAPSSRHAVPDNAAIVNAPVTNHTWPFEFNNADGLDKTESNRYTKDQYEDGLARNLKYNFELPNGTYKLEVLFQDPWGVSNHAIVSAEDEVLIEDAYAGAPHIVDVTVKDGELTLDITAPDETLAINLSYIKIYMPGVDPSNPSEGEDPDKETIGVLGSYDLDDVDILDSYLMNAESKDVTYLLKLDSDRLLAGFRETAGLDMKGKQRYGGGWEDALIGGHTMGHYMTALAQAVQTLEKDDPNRAQLEQKLNYIIDELAKCQEALGTGYIFGAKLVDKNNVYAQFDNVEKGLINISTQAWVPWYTMHKILAGLIDTYKYTGNETALEVAKKLGDWVADRALGWDTHTRNTVLGIEYGGMNDCLYELYAVTGEDIYAKAAHVFDEDSLFKAVAAGTKNC